MTEPVTVAPDHRLEASFTPGADGDLPALVFLHEGLGCVELWRTFPADVRAACGNPATLAYSRAGYGRSAPAPLPRPATYMHEEADRIVPAVLDHWAIERCVLVGHSDGASIALLAAGGDRSLAARIAGLVLLAPHVFVEEVGLEAIAAAADAYRSGDLRSRLARYHDDVDNAFWGWNEVWLSPEFRSWDITGRLGAIGCPVALIQGTDDPYGTAAQLGAISGGVPGAVTTTMIDGVGHAPHLEAPEETRAATVALIETVGRQSAGEECR